MLTTATKKKIDTARDILLGKIPMPTSQVEQITLALIYKFMSDMDKKAKKLGDASGFFANGYEKYAWDKLMDKALPARERVLLYREALEKMALNPHIPQMFRDVFRNASLPFNDPETLKLFLDVINQFEYDHSEELGNAFEYLLQVMGSQGDAGQFRTPRHIIDFIVEVIEPQKMDKILDPACGTAGFLISAYKYLKEKGLSSEEMSQISENFVGYDYSPDMQRLSLVNMYLHHFPNPHIFEYDTLTSEDRWHENFDVILANPPFMSPKGGIRPHNHFSVPSNRAEVLFVDYIMEHLSSKGKAGVIVPEGIIFQSQNAYKALRKMMVEENFLWAVVSLPAGVFNPYAGVKTSILFFDREIAKKNDSILFVKVENDGFGLGAQRRESDKNDLPEALNWLKQHKNIEITNGYKEVLLSETAKTMVNLVKKSEIAKNGDYNLSGERYRDNVVYTNTKWPMVELGNSELFQIESGGTPSTKEDSYWNGNINWVTLVDLPQTNLITEINNSVKRISESGLKNSSAKLLPIETIVVSSRATIGRIGISKIPLATNQGFKNITIKDKNKILPKFVAFVLTAKVEQMKQLASGGTFAEISKTSFSTIKIPLPPLSVQQEIVEEIDRYQKIVDGARQVVDNYQPSFEIQSDWKTLKLVDAPLEIIDGDRGSNYPQKTEFTKSGYCLFLNTKNVRQNGFAFNELEFIGKERDEKLRKGKLQRNDVVLTTRGTIGNVGYYSENVSYENVRINSGMIIVRSQKEILSPEYVFYFLQSTLFKTQIKQMTSGSAQPQLPIRSLNNILIAIPPLDVQISIVDEMKKNDLLVNSSRLIAEKFKSKIEEKINSMWKN